MATKVSSSPAFSSPALSPRPNPPGPSGRAVPKAKALAILNATKSPAPSVASTPGDGGMDLSEKMNDEVRRQFVIGGRLGEGTYATVYAGHYRHDPTSLVAIKKIKVNADFKDGIAMDAIREIKFLSELHHPNIISLHAVFSTKDQNLSLVLEHLPAGDLEGLWKNGSISYTSADIKAWSNMLAQAVWFCHENFVLHRDIKGNNVLIAADGTLKLADFGLARSFAEPGRPMTHQVITRFYRPLELLYGARHYGGCVDIWSMGIVIAELVIREFFLPSETDIQQVHMITEIFGTPTEETWPGVSMLPNYLPIGPSGFKHPLGTSYFMQRFPLLGADGVELLRGMLTVDPAKRFTANEVLRHSYWTNAPTPTKKEMLPKAGGGLKAMGEDLKRRGGEADTGRVDKVARKLDFASMVQ
ncbi:serine/threonine-protein kinase crk1 [Lojkania enalia]|uniref:Serine/threonine-protein kinase crk1 n=1 Tax=Lojkania enalia TaxID=147567 RepID=A0A9P4K0P8_9PLEO|nr:serine/threonine-protein kinase crk1 [Didymosphaeria enalia]